MVNIKDIIVALVFNTWLILDLTIVGVNLSWNLITIICHSDLRPKYFTNTGSGSDVSTHVLEETPLLIVKN